jgi:hypothetical protein
MLKCYFIVSLQIERNDHRLLAVIAFMSLAAKGGYYIRMLARQINRLIMHPSRCGFLLFLIHVAKLIQTALHVRTHATFPFTLLSTIIDIGKKHASII